MSLPCLPLLKTRIALAAAALAAGAGLVTPALAKAPAGGEFRVNTSTTGNQESAAIAMDADGDFVVVWHGRGSGGLFSIFGQRYSASGLAQGGEFAVLPPSATNSANTPAIAMDAAGNSVVIWQLNGVQAQRLDPSGSPLGAQFQVAPAGHREHAIAMQANGSFVVVSHIDESTRVNPNVGNGISAQRYQADGTALGSRLRVNTFNTGHQQFPAVAMDADGDFVVAWESAAQDGSSEGIYAQRYNAAGTPQGSEFRVNTYTTDRQRVPAVAMDTDGDFVVAWGSYAQDGSDFGIYAQRYSAAGVAQGGEFQVNTYTTGLQGGSAIAMDADGDFVVSWQSDGQDGDDLGIYARRYSAAGVAQGSEFRVNTTTTGAQTSAALAMDADGDFLVAWDSLGQDDPAAPTAPGVYAQRYQAVTLTPSLTVTTSGAATNTTPVANGPAGTYSFNAQFCNNTAQTMTGLSSKTLTLSNGNNLLNRTRDALAAPGAAAIPAGGPGTEKDVVAGGGYSDLALSNGECVTVPYQIGLTNRDKFNFTVRIRGDNGM